MMPNAVRFRLLWACCMTTLIIGASLISRIRFGLPLNQGPLIRPMFWAITLITCVIWALQAWTIKKQKRGN